MFCSVVSQNVVSFLVSLFDKRLKKKLQCVCKDSYRSMLFIKRDKEESFTVL